LPNDPIDSTTAQMLSDGSWFCSSCRSLNTRGAPRCYSCHAESLFATTKVASGGVSKSLIGVGSLVLMLAIMGGGLIVGGALAGGSVEAPSAGPIAYVGAPPDPIATLSPPTETPTPTEVPTAAATPIETPTPAPTASIPVPTRTPATKPPLMGVALPVIPVAISGVTITYYSISGSTENELIDAINAGGPGACKLEDAAACFYPTFAWSYSGSVDASSGVCSVKSVTFKATYSIILPKWVSPARVSTALATWWKKVMDHIIWHETQHFIIARDTAAKLTSGIAGGPCDQAGQNKITARLNAQLEADQNAFDAKDRSWTWPAL
jgi:predicted secreted Zn-dependent protease